MSGEKIAEDGSESDNRTVDEVSKDEVSTDEITEDYRGVQSIRDEWQLMVQTKTILWKYYWNGFI